MQPEELHEAEARPMAESRSRRQLEPHRTTVEPRSARESRLVAALTSEGTRLGSGCVAAHASMSASMSAVSWCKLGSSQCVLTSSKGWPRGSCAVSGLLAAEIRQAVLWAQRVWCMAARSETAN